MSRKFDYPTLWNWNGNLLCSIDCETTGDQAGFHDIIEIAILPLNSDIQINKQFIPFCITIQPKRPENYLDESTRVDKVKYANAKLKGIEAYRAADLLDEWFLKLKLPEGKRIIPLACYWPHDRAFLIDWLGWKNFHHMFDVRYRDVQTIALFQNDTAEFQVEQIPYPKVKLQYLCSEMRIERTRPHTAIEDAVVTAEVYRQLIKRHI